MGNLPFTGSKLLPWEPVLARFAEPGYSGRPAPHDGGFIDQSSLRCRGYSPKQSVTATFGVVGARLPTQWTSVEQTWNAEVSAGYTDGEKLEGTSGSGAGTYLGLYANEASNESFDAPSELVYYWGAASQLNPDSGAGVCEYGGCVQIGPVANVDCGADPSGMAVRLSVPAGATTIKIRYRLLAEGTNTVSPSLGGVAPLSIQVARLGQIPVRESVVVNDVTDLGTQPDGYRFGTSWTTREVALPVGDGEVGIAIRTGGSSADRTCLGGQASSDAVNVELFVDSISVE
ncbi:MAG: hypothetical protein U0165_18560 [Polyangiaceae bacterium]